VDVLSGLHAAAGVLAALHGGRGGHIEVPLVDSGLAGLVNVAQNALVTGREPERHGNAHPNIVPYQDFETSSGRIAVAAANDGLFRALCGVLGLEELSSDERFATNSGRVQHRGELVPLLADRFRERAAEDWLGELDAAGVPAGKVRSVPDALAAAAEAGRPATLTVEHPTAGRLDLVASPIWGASVADPLPPPLLGEHTREVLGELGLDAAAVADLAERGVVGLNGEQ
jgi:crotonobetainyl-CoA:carnitine CoA-transferase CaiB-like acyl-CoA transferase